MHRLRSSGVHSRRCRSPVRSSFASYRARQSWGSSIQSTSAGIVGRHRRRSSSAVEAGLLPGRDRTPVATRSAPLHMLLCRPSGGSCDSQPRSSQGRGHECHQDQELAMRDLRRQRLAGPWHQTYYTEHDWECQGTLGKGRQQALPDL